MRVKEQLVDFVHARKQTFKCNYYKYYHVFKTRNAESDMGVKIVYDLGLKLYTENSYVQNLITFLLNSF